MKNQLLVTTKIKHKNRLRSSLLNNMIKEKMIHPLAGTKGPIIQLVYSFVIFGMFFSLKFL